MVKTMRKFLAVVLAAAMALSVNVQVFAAQYGDTQGHWAESFINKWSDNGILTGNEGLFKPDDNMTYAEFATIISKLMGYSAKAKNTYSDVKDNVWYTDAVLKLVEAGVMTSKGNMLTPDEPLTRADEFIMLAKAFGLTPVTGATSFLDDSAIPASAKGYIKALAQKGVLTGYEVERGYEVRATGNITRAELLTTFGKMAPNFINTAATYTTDYEGNLVINTAGVKLSGNEIKGDLYLVQGIGSGDIHLNDVTVTGNAYFYGGGINSIYLSNFKCDTIIIQKQDGEISLKTEDLIDVNTIIVQSGCTLNLPEDWAGDIVIQKGADVSKPVTINGRADTVSSYAEGASITINGEIKTVDLFERASISGTGKVETINQSTGERSSIAGTLDVKKKNITTTTGGTSSVKPNGSGSGNTSGQQKDPKLVISRVEVLSPFEFNVVMNSYSGVHFSLSGNSYDGNIVKGDYDSGAYSVTATKHLNPGNYNLTASLSGYQSASISFTVPDYYTVKYNANGGKGEIDEYYLTDENFVVRDSTGISREHYDFTGWYSEKTGGVEYDSGKSYALTDNLTLYAQWRATEYTVTFDTNGATGTAPAAMTGNYNSKITLPAGTGLTKTNHVFFGWNKVANDTAGITGEYTITGDATLYAIWGKMTVTVDPREPELIGDGSNELRFTVKTENIDPTESTMAVDWVDGTGFSREVPPGIIISENTFSGSSGSLILKSNNPKPYHFWVSVKGIQSDLVTLTVLDPSSGYYKVSGTLTVDGTPASGIRITFTDTDGKTYSTISSSTYSIKLPAGTYTYTLQKPTATDDRYEPGPGTNFEFVVGTADVTHNISAEQVKAPAIGVNTAIFDRDNQDDVTFTVNLGGGGLKATGITSVKAGDTILTPDTEDTPVTKKDYSFDGTTLTINKEYLAIQKIGELELDVVFNDTAATEVTLTITINAPTNINDIDNFWSHFAKKVDVLSGVGGNRMSTSKGLDEIIAHIAANKANSDNKFFYAMSYAFKTSDNQAQAMDIYATNSNQRFLLNAELTTEVLEKKYELSYAVGGSATLTPAEVQALPPIEGGDITLKDLDFSTVTSKYQYIYVRITDENDVLISYGYIRVFRSIPVVVLAKDGDKNNAYIDSINYPTDGANAFKGGKFVYSYFSENNPAGNTKYTPVRLTFNPGDTVTLSVVPESTHGFTYTINGVPTSGSVNSTTYLIGISETPVTLGNESFYYIEVIYKTK